MKSKDRASFRISLFVAVGLLLLLPASARAQTVVATIPVGTDIPRAVAVNPVTNKIYVASCTFHGMTGPPTGSLTVIDGATNSTTVIKGCFWDVAVNSVTNKIYVPSAVIDGATDVLTYIPGIGGDAVAVNPVTNKIYVANDGGYTYVIDGATNSTTTVIDPNALPLHAAAIAVNPVTNKIYVANNGIFIPFNTNPGNVTVINGATNSATTLTDPNASTPVSVAVNILTNKIYIANQGSSPNINNGNITVIDGATSAITTLTDPNAVSPQAVALNQTTNKIYVANGSSNVTVIDGATNAISTLKDPNAMGTNAVAVDSATNTIYVTSGGVTVINGATNSVATVIDPNASNHVAVAVNPAMNMIYVVNYNYVAAKGTVTVIDGGATPTSHVLSVVLEGSGSGTVTSNPAGINCGTSCAASFTPGTTVSLAASSASGSQFSGWSTNCSGMGSCNVTLTTSDEFVTATFNTGPPPDFSITPASASLTLQRGAQVTDVITIAPLNGSFSNAVQLSCAIARSSPLATCSLSPTSVTPGANSVTSTLTVTAPSQSARLILPSKGQLSSPLYAVFLPMALALIGLSLASCKSRNRRSSLWLLCGLFVAFVALQAGCGGGSSNPPPPPPPALNYTVTVTATSGTIQHTNLVNVTVQ